ncbi:hypothetical protein HF995_13435 [Sanguibacter hominis ATCC BAA-789]|uniref:TrbL/VirB6 plasmid conjugal transfer protein n=1 Tax=Sanguibacter hominis ATCC BAA-789 TaxID=1312740 RepID=A0A9X5FGU7_9MICO|nr:hypothetical protein [Sanguibacter hominis]NKX94259.1 hypothetical protein [Sanguibacter hominis ATCC BAA-789]
MANEILSSFSSDMAESAWGFLVGAFTGSASYISDEQWSVATIFTNRFAAVMAIFTVIAALLQIVRALFAGRTRDVLIPAVAAVLAWPVTAVSVWLTIRAAGALDHLVRAMFGSSDDSALESIFLPLAALGTETSPLGTGGFGATLLLLALVWIASLVLSLVMIFRNFALLILVAFAPVALMLLPASITRSWSKVWAQSVVALIIAKPLAAGVLLIAAELTATADGMAQVLTGLTGLIVACASPAGALQLVRFTGATSATTDTAATAGAITSPAGKAQRTFTSASHTLRGMRLGGGGASRASAGVARTQAVPMPSAKGAVGSGAGGAATGATSSGGVGTTGSGSGGAGTSAGSKSVAASGAASKPASTPSSSSAGVPSPAPGQVRPTPAPAASSPRVAPAQSSPRPAPAPAQPRPAPAPQAAPVVQPVSAPRPAAPSPTPPVPQRTDR